MLKRFPTLSHLMRIPSCTLLFHKQDCFLHVHLEEPGEPGLISLVHLAQVEIDRSKSNFNNLKLHFFWFMFTSVGSILYLLPHRRRSGQTGAKHTYRSRI